jgi:DNA-directed RNA polymerase subunit N (RpoN/RPB10)
MMTDVWCFTCSHEIKEIWPGFEWVHVDDDDRDDCPCMRYAEKCQP